MESTRNASLPDELVGEILLKLPVKSLKRFRCVCRCWLSCIDSPDFVKMHYRTNKVRGSNLQFIFRSVHREGGLYGFLGGKPRLSLLCSETMLVKEKMDFPLLDMIGESEGLILCVEDFRAGLLNPATREFKFIPQSTMKQPHCIFVRVWGFGYDVSTDDYKVVRFIVNQFNHNVQLQAEIYTLSSNRWREIHCHPFVPSGSGSGSSMQFSTYIHNTYVNGHYHWWLDFPNTILAFDMADESFCILHFPFPDELHRSSYLRIFGNYLAIFASSRDGDNTITIWLMKDYGVEESWTKQSVIELIPQVVELLGIWKNDEWLSETRGDQLMLYNSQTKVVKDLKLCDDYTMYSPLVVFTDSLYLLNGTFLNKIDVEEEPSSVMDSVEGEGNI